MTMSSADAPTDTLTRLEEEIARVEEEKARMEEEKARTIHQRIVFLSDLRAKRNSLLPIFRLPPETLEIIFIHGARDHDDRACDCEAPFSVPTWVNVSYVCDHWRKIALNCPTLWTYHFTLSLRWTEELLFRSKQASLKISCCRSFRKSDWWWSSIVDNLMKHSERIQELRLSLPRLPAKLSMCASRLEILEIDLMWQPEWSLVIADGDTPVLRILKLTHYRIPWYSLNLKRLTTLSLFHAPSELSMGDFLAVLKGMQELTILKLGCVLPSARRFLSSGALGNSPNIDLPRLALLVIIAPSSAVVALLSCVNIPLKTRLSLKPLPEPGSSVRDYAPISSFLAQRFSTSQELSSSGPIFRSLIIDTNDDPELTFSSSERDCYPPRSPTFTPESDYNVPLMITLGEEHNHTEEMADSDKHCIMSDICCSLPLSNIQSLHIYRPCEFSSAVWKKILGCLDGLRYMMLSYGFMPDLAVLSLAAHESNRSLCGQSACDQDSTSGHIFLPALEELELNYITFIPDDMERQGSMSQKSLFDTLSTRKGLRDRLTTTGCKVAIND